MDKSEEIKNSICTFNLDRLFDLNVDKIYQENLASSTQFTDDTFPPDESSLHWPNEHTPAVEDLRAKVDHWARPKGLVEGSSIGPDLFSSNGISPISGKEGVINDDWIIASIAALAEKPD